MNMKLSTKIITAAAAAVIVTALGASITVFWISKNNRIFALHDQMSVVLKQAKTVADDMDKMHWNKAFDMKGLLAAAKQNSGNRPLKETYRDSALYDTIPIVASWQAAAVSARDQGYEFFTPSHPDLAARNSKNNNGAQFEAAFKAFAAGQTEYFFQDKEKNELVLAQPVRLTESCLVCHGDPANSSTHDGLDLLGFPMENMKTGDIKGAFVLKAPLTNDAVMAKTMKTMALVCLVLLGVAGVGFHFFSERFVSAPLNKAINNIGLGASQVLSASSELSATSQKLAEGASEQAASLEETSASLEEIDSMTKRNSDSAELGVKLSKEARETAAAGLDRISELSHTLDSIKLAVAEMQATVAESQASSQEISKIIKTIDEIAFQTNLLALNAAVEAARAGDAGMGFAVVADEVRALAQRSAQAARDTSNKIESAVKRSERGGVASSKVVKSLSEVEATAQSIQQVFTGIVNQIKSLDGVIAEIAAASKEQSQGISEVNMAVSQMDKVTQTNAASAEENAGSSEEMNAQAVTLQGIVGELQTVVTGQQPNGAAAHIKPAPTGKAKELAQASTHPRKNKSGVSLGQFDRDSKKSVTSKATLPAFEDF